MPVVRRPNQPHILLIQRFALLTVIIACATFFASHNMRMLCFLLIPLLYLLSQSAYPDNPSKCYENINNQPAIRAILDSLPVPHSELSNWLSRTFSLVWPHIFQQERIDQFKEQIQGTLDAQQNGWVVKLDALEIGDRAPQITKVKVPERPLAAEYAILFEVGMCYYPEYKLACTVTPPAGPSFRVTFTNLVVDVDLIIQYEFVEGPFIEGVPFITAIVFSLLKPPRLNANQFKITLFSGSSVLNRDFIKKAIADAIGQTAWSIAGSPKGCVLERLSGSWQVTQVIDGERVKRHSKSLGELRRYSRIKCGAVKMCEELKMPQPLTLKTVSYKDIEVCGRNLETLNSLRENLTLSTIARYSGQFMSEPLSPDELKWFVAMTIDVMERSFQDWAAAAMQQKRRPDGQEIGQFYVYLNCLTHQSMLNPGVADAINLTQRQKKLEEAVFAIHKRMQKMK
jgi:hypothetical protein